MYEVSKDLWDYNFSTTIFLLNRIPCIYNEGYKSPLEMVYKEKPNWDSLIPFGCPGIYNVTKEERTYDRMFSNKGRICRYMGMTNDGSGYDVLDLQSDRDFS